MNDKKVDLNTAAEEIETRKLKRRQVLHMGWTAPVIAALALKAPNVAFAQSSHGDYTDHDDAAHTDGVHTDHTDHLDAKKHADSK